jgi:hypothetical protein
VKVKSRFTSRHLCILCATLINFGRTLSRQVKVWTLRHMMTACQSAASELPFGKSYQVDRYVFPYVVIKLSPSLSLPVIIALTLTISYSCMVQGRVTRSRKLYLHPDHPLRSLISSRHKAWNFGSHSAPMHDMCQYFF